MTEQEVIEHFRKSTIAAGGQKAWAEAHGFSTAFVNDVLRGRRVPTDRLLRALGLERVVTYQPISQANDSQHDSHEDSEQNKGRAD